MREPFPAELLQALAGIPALASLFKSVARESPGAGAAGVQPSGGDSRAYHVHKLTGSARTMMAAALRRSSGRPLVYVAPDSEKAESARDDLEFWLGRDQVVYFAEHDETPYDIGIRHVEATASRLEALVRLATTGDAVLVMSAHALGQRVVGPDVLKEGLVSLAIGSTIDVDRIAEKLAWLGYRRTPMVEEVGEFSRRGGILDVYSPGHDNPIRVEIDDDFVASMREFDVIHQRSIRPLDRVDLLPTHEVILDPDRVELALLDLDESKPELATELRETFDADLYPEGVERLAPYLNQELGPITRYLPAGTLVVQEEPGLVLGAVEAQWDEATAAWGRLHVDLAHLAPPERLFLTKEEVVAGLAPFEQVRLSALTADAAGAQPVEVRSVPPENFGRNLKMWQEYLVGLHEKGEAVYLLCDNPGQQNRLDEILVEEGTPVRLELGVLSEGFRLPELRITVLTDHEFFGRVRRARRARRFKSGFGLKELTSLRPGIYIVHVEHGIGIYRGISRLEINGQLTDCLLLEYAGGDRLYLPVDQLDRVQKYASEEGARPSLSKLGGAGWSKAKEKTKAAIKEIAGELIALYARRRALPGHAFSADTVWQQELEGTFPFDETPDQLKAVEEVTKDMESGVPMDRLVCGDVGYGKTEVAVRAAFKAVMDGRQAAVLVPTTILAQQHFNTFRERYAEFPVRVELLSRFRSPKEIEQVQKGITDGTVNVVIGTHALLGARVKFKDLGLVIVDEEQRFGVTHKERLRQVRTQVDVLTLTATPIPRTLNMSMLGARDISAINTPPRDRLPIHTEIAEFEPGLIQDALLREADRGGQSYFVHNRVQSIDEMAIYIHKLCPMLRIGVAHGQMSEKPLEKVMLDFIEKRLDVLVATMIIENGLDIPAVNTMIVNRADTLGLAQLYQLRGRVGRSNVRASCYFLVPSRTVLTEGAMKRLRAIAEFDELGSGFALAMRDLEIRGAGNLLGAEQHGFVATVGFDMYCRLLDEAVKELKGLPVDEHPEPKLVTDLAAFLPDEYVSDAEEKVALYKRLADLREPEELDRMVAEMTDRFGRLSAEARALFELRRLKVLGRLARAVQIQVRGGRVEVELFQAPAREELKEWMQRLTIPVEFAAGARFGLKVRKVGPDPLATAVRLLEQLTGSAAPGVEAAS